MATLQNREIDFREKRGTVDAIVSLMEELKVEIKSHPEKVTQCILLDWKKALDAVNHSVLLQNLHDMGFWGPVNKFLKFYVSDRTQ